MTTETFHSDRKLSERARSNLYLAALRTFDEACMAAAESGSDLFAAHLDDMATDDIIALSLRAGADIKYYNRARDFLHTCEGEPNHVLKF